MVVPSWAVTLTSIVFAPTFKFKLPLALPLATVVYVPLFILTSMVALASSLVGVTVMLLVALATLVV